MTQERCLLEKKTNDTSKGNPWRLRILVFLAIQNSVLTLLMRYSRSRQVDQMFRPSIAVLFTELLKTIFCLAVLVYQEGLGNGVKQVRENVFEKPTATLMVCIPAMLYVIQGNLAYIAASHLEAAVFAILSQLKVFTAALCSVLILGRSLTGFQWLALIVLFSGVSLVQHEAAALNDHKEGDGQNPFIGLVCVVVACSISGLAGAYIEKILKGSVSLWIRNLQMSVFSIPSAIATICIQDGDFVQKNGVLYGFDIVVWCIVLWYGIGGISVALCLKYADNVSKDFSTSVAIVIATLGSMILFSFHPSFIFIIGASLVIIAIFLYSSPPFITDFIARKRYRSIVPEEDFI